MAALSSDTGWVVGARDARVWADTFHRNLTRGSGSGTQGGGYWCSGSPASGTQVLGGFKRQLKKGAP